MDFPGPDGNLHRFWIVVDSGVVGEDGIARTSSPPYPGLSRQGSVAIARANQPVITTRIDPAASWLIQGTMHLLLNSSGLGAIPQSHDLLERLLDRHLPGRTQAMYCEEVVDDDGNVTRLCDERFYALPIQTGISDVRVWREWGEEVVEDIIPVSINTNTQRVSVRLDDIPEDRDDPPEIWNVSFDVASRDLTIDGRYFSDPGPIGPVEPPPPDDSRDSRVVFQMGSRRVVVDGDEFLVADGTVIRVQVPPQVLLGAAEILVERPQSAGAGVLLNRPWLSSNAAQVFNGGEYGFVAYVSPAVPGLPTPATGMMTIGVLRTGGPDPNALFKEIPDVGRFIKDSVTTSDRSRLYFALEGGVAVLDAVTLEQHDVDPTTPETDVIRLIAVLDDELQYAGQIFAVTALDPDGRYLYAAGYDHVFVIDVRPSSETFQ